MVDEDRYRKIKLMDLSPHLFTTEKDGGRLHIKNIKGLKDFE